ncbi:MAG: hypothetical protein ThorAB25_17410 [Candidatus Thorarchaeota archaeon AB_25]|nr:MAG: hypothetical protein ThorAB25_17410 [Candidatus Thorarchaeota archaeon AB_25]
MTTPSLKEKYNKAASFLKDKKSSDEVTTLIHRTPWVRILLEHDQQEGDSLFIEVEMSLPESAGMKESDSSEVIDRLTEHLQYLQTLREVGFELSVIGTGCIYCASKELHDTPEDNLFRALIPP